MLAHLFIKPAIAEGPKVSLQQCLKIESNKDDRQNLIQGTRQFERYKFEKHKEILHKNDGYRLESLPFALLHRHKTEFAVLLIHGLYDSPYYVANLAQTLHDTGFNVVTILLPGHGTDNADILNIRAEQWRDEVETGLGIAALVGRKTVVGGFSLGGSLAIDAALRNSNIKALLLYAPAIRLPYFEDLYGLACLPGLRSMTINTKMEINPIKYKYRYVNGICQVHRLLSGDLDLMAEINQNIDLKGEVAKLYQTAEQIHIPTFGVMTYEDARVSVGAILDYFRRVKAPTLLTTFGEKPESDVDKVLGNTEIVHINDQRLPHGFLIRRDNQYNGHANPFYDQVIDKLLNFLNTNLCQ